jgi:uncharacterized protein involved in propanediol utilization
MKPKVFVGIALMLSILVAGLILIFGFVSTVMLPVYLLSFLLIFFAIAIISMRTSLEDKILITSVILILLSISATMFLTNLRTYYDVANEYSNPESVPEIQLLQLENQYYSEYANYLNLKVSEYQMQIKAEETQLAVLDKLRQELIDQQNAAAIAAAEAALQQQNTVPEDYYINYNYEREYGEEDDD